MITAEDALHFAEEWIQAWNEHDLDTVLDYYAVDVEYYSPLVSEVLKEESGHLQGYKQVKEYFNKVLQAFPGLHFELVSVFAGVESLVIRYQNSAGRLAADMLVLNEQGMISEVRSHYYKKY